MTQINSNQATVTEDDLKGLARLVHSARPDWNPMSVLTMLRDLAQTYDFVTLRQAAHTAAHAKHIKTPKGIEFEAANIVEGLSATSAPLSKQRSCTVCGKPEDVCRFGRPKAARPELEDDHVFTPSGSAACSPRAGWREAAATGTR